MKITDKKAFVCPIDEPVPIAYLNIYEASDVWIKIKTCEGCQGAEKCCGKCAMLVNGKCLFHFPETQSKGKPFICLSLPTPDTCMSFCQLEFECIKGKHKGKIRKVSESMYVFHEAKK